ncbi:DinB family protein [Pedobacter sp. MC2016-05]|uniref:DinB family protein n=1 Tax=Pedobacter sp. MC2016-05 TaxID=2994474 RepID=UPI0022484751|nr:DinB family protein [Pedobacter sp. MC2016-05]MCX2475146.1 DinB family protein [Pedobacter sp. MC2016-05]
MLKQQYELVLFSRETILDYIKTISHEDFICDNSAFGKGSIRNLLVHICDTYSSWIAERGLGLPSTYPAFDNYSTLNDCIKYFNRVNLFIDQFLNQFEGNYQEEIQIVRNGTTTKISVLQLFTHVITHEFHHKGQIMSLSRILGYTPVDADIIR